MNLKFPYKLIIFHQYLKLNNKNFIFFLKYPKIDVFELDFDFYL